MAKVEYEIAGEIYRSFLDHRMRMLNYAVAFNAALLVVPLQYVESGLGRSALALLGGVSALLFLLFELRTIQITNAFWEQMECIEKDMKYKVFSNVSDATKVSGVPQKIVIRTFYVLLVLTWGIVFSYESLMLVCSP